jgi:tryptophan-rich sensory protein
MTQRGRSAVALVSCVAACFAAAGIGSVATARSVSTWYQELAKPPFSPPDWVFGPVWTVLFVMMAVAAWLVWRRRGLRGGAVPLTLFGVQLALNAAWSWLFFGFQLPGVAFVELIVLWVAIAATLVAFWRTSRAAGLLLAPYLLWVSFAAALNFAFWRLNA